MKSLALYLLYSFLFVACASGKIENENKSTDVSEFEFSLQPAFRVFPGKHPLLFASDPDDYNKQHRNYLDHLPDNKKGFYNNINQKEDRLPGKRDRKAIQRKPEQD